MSSVCHSKLKVYGPPELAEKARGLIELAFGACMPEHEKSLLETEADNPPLAVVRLESEEMPPFQRVALVSLCGPEFRCELVFINSAGGLGGSRVFQGGAVTSNVDERHGVEAEPEPTAAAPSIVNAGDTQSAHVQVACSKSDRGRRARDSILAEARRRANGGRDIESPADETLPWVQDSWVGECETAGVYSRIAPTFDYSQRPVITATLTPAELRLLVQRHINTLLQCDEFFAWNGFWERAWEVHAMAHEFRLAALVELLPPEDQQRFQQQLEIRGRYIQSVRAEVTRCEKVEADFWDRADAGLVSKAEIAEHKTPPFIRGAPVMPSPADGSPDPERWDLYLIEE